MLNRFFNCISQLKSTKLLNLLLYKFEEISDFPVMQINRNLNNYIKKRYIDYVLNTKKQKILIIEPNKDSHAETILSVWNYFKKLNYKADIIIAPVLYKEGALNKIKNKANIFVLDTEKMKNIIKNSFLNNYKAVFFNSYNVYFGQYNLDKDIVPTIFDYYEFPKTTAKFMGYLHHLSYSKHCTEYNFKYFSLANLNKEYANKKTMLNPHYFGKIKLTQKNRITNFIVVGKIEPLRKSAEVLINAVRCLHDANITNFKITLVGVIRNYNIPDELRKYFTVTGRVSFPELDKYMKQSDFFLPLLDSENPYHDRYITKGTSGGFQLIYGYLKPCLIHNKFASTHYFNNQNSLIYSKNDELHDFMIKAINMNNKTYRDMQNNLKNTSDEISKVSLENLKNIIEEI